jgi:hypothetical protein
MTHAEQIQRSQLTALLPELREAFRERWAIQPVLSAHGLNRRVLAVLEELEVIRTKATSSRRWTYYEWTYQHDDQTLIDQLLDQPYFSLTREQRQRLNGRYGRASGKRTCSRCGRLPRRGTILLRTVRRGEVSLICPTCRRPDDEPLHEVELEKFRSELQKLHLLWPDDLPTLARQLRRLAGQLHEVERLRTRPRRGSLTAWARRFEELATWLQKAFHMLEPHRRRVLAEPVIDPELPAPYDLAEVVSEHPSGAVTRNDRATREAILRSRARQQERRRSADMLHEGLAHATEWVQQLRHDLTLRRLELEN